MPPLTSKARPTGNAPLMVSCRVPPVTLVPPVKVLTFVRTTVPPPPEPSVTLLMAVATAGLVTSPMTAETVPFLRL